MAFLDESLPGRPWEPERRRVIAHPGAPRPLEAAMAGASGSVLAALGPEGGWIRREVETFEARGFEVVHLGEAVLDLASSAASLLGQLELLGRLRASGMTAGTEP